MEESQQKDANINNSKSEHQQENNKETVLILLHFHPKKNNFNCLLLAFYTPLSVFIFIPIKYPHYTCTLYSRPWGNLQNLKEKNPRENENLPVLLTYVKL